MCATRSFVSHQLKYRHISVPQGTLSVGTDEAVCLPFESHGPAPMVANKGGTKDSSNEAKISGSAAAHSSGATAGGLASSSAPPFIDDHGRGGLGVEVKYPDSCVSEEATADAFDMASYASGDPKVCTPRVRRVV